MKIFGLDVYFKGILDSLKIWYPIQLIWTSTNIRHTLGASLIVNFVVFFTNYYYLYVIPIWYPKVWLYFGYVYLVLWYIPCYVGIVYLNHQWSTHMVTRLCQKKYGEQKYANAETAYGMFLVYLFQLVIALINTALVWNWVKLLVTFFTQSWLAAFCLFETRLIYKGYSLNQRIEFFQRRWLYFLGYGTVWGLMYLCLPYRIMYSLYYSISGIMILNTINITPLKFDQLVSLPIFGIANFVGDRITGGGFKPNSVTTPTKTMSAN